MIRNKLIIGLQIKYFFMYSFVFYFIEESLHHSELLTKQKQNIQLHKNQIRLNTIGKKNYTY
jgi:hypothetical protein